MYPSMKFYLKENLKRASLDFKLSDEENENIFLYLNENFPQRKYKECELTLKQVFSEYFENIGYLLFKISDNQIKFRVFEYKIKPENSVNLDSLIEIIHNNEDLIVDNYKNKDDQFLIPQELFTKIYDFTKTIENEKINKKELVKHSVREAFELKESDIVIIQKNQIFIKLFEIKKATKESSNEKRFNGIDENLLQSFYTDHFQIDANKKFFSLIAKLFIDMHFIDSQIDNNNYEKHVFGHIHSIINEQLTNSFDHSDEFFKGFSGYIFRIHFKEVFEYISDYILIELTSSNNHVVEFLKYYSLNVVLVNGEKYKVPILETDDGLKWNVVSMLSIAKIYIGIKLSIKELKRNMHKVEEQISSLYIDEYSPIEFQAQYFKDLKEIDSDIYNQVNKLNIYISSLKAEKDEARKEIFNQEINQINQIIKELSEEKVQLNSCSIDKNTINEFEELERVTESIKRKIKRERELLSQNEEAYQSIKGALLKVLISKKQKIV